VSPHKSDATRRAERSKAKPLVEHFGSYSIAAVSANLVAAYRDARISGGLKPNTVRLELALLSHLFTTAIREWQLGLTYNPVINIRKPSPGPGRERRLSLDEEHRLRAAVEAHSNPMLAWIVGIALETGMRASEIAGLRLAELDLQKRVVRLSKTKNGSARTVPLSRSATAILQQAIEHPARPDDCDLVFFGDTGKDGTRRPYAFNKTWIKLRNKAGIVDFRFHDLRHEAVSRFVERGLADQEVSAISGHRSMQMLKRYTHLRAEDLVTKLDAVEPR
jgi:integrase